MRVPKISNVETAVRIYYNNYELGRSEIMELFGCGSTKAAELKRAAAAYMNDNGFMLRVNSAVCTDLAYKAWGLDIGTLEAMYRKQKNLGLIKHVDE